MLRHVGGVMVARCCRCWPPFERGERDLEGDGIGGYGARGERIAMVAWKILTRRRKKMINSAYAPRRVVSNGGDVSLHGVITPAIARLFSHDDWNESW